MNKQKGILGRELTHGEKTKSTKTSTRCVQDEYKTSKRRVLDKYNTSTRQVQDKYNSSKKITPLIYINLFKR